VINKVYCDDFFKIVDTLPDGIIDFFFIDPPYFKVKGEFDFKMEFQEWLDFHNKLADVCYRLLKDNGSLVLWGHAKRIAYQQIEFDKYFNFLNSCVWEKNECQTKKNSMEDARCFLPITERFLFYDKGEDKSGLTMIFSNPDLFQPIKEYLRKERKKTNLQKCADINKLLGCDVNGGGMASHYFSNKKTHKQWVFPTKEMYQRLQTTGFFKKKYEELRQEYEELRQEYEELRRYFSLTDKIKYDVIKWSQESNITKNNNHETCKPPGLVTEIIKTCCKKGGLVCEPFAGSAPARFSSFQLGMNYIGCEINKNYWHDQEDRYKQFLDNYALIDEALNQDKSESDLLLV
jgi:site-specific DNA-methyltransferase (adenine-specific)